MDNSYSKLNNLVGWSVFLIATIVYILTIEETASYWDCGEFIASANGLEIGHPPGAPLWMLLGRFFILFAGGNEAMIPYMVNVFSALCSSFTILFLFWTITAFAKKIVAKWGEMTQGTLWAIMGSGAVGALAYTFSDSFWFSAVEAEVYAASSMFTALVFWLAMKWDQAAGEPRADRYLVLIAYLMGLSIGVHLLNLITVPAIALIFYFKRKEITLKGIGIALGVGLLILMTIQTIIPYTVKVAAAFELQFVNGMGMGYHSGLYFFFIFLIALFGGIFYYSHKKSNFLLNKIALCFAFVLVGYSPYALIVIRSLANPPMDEGDPQDIYKLQSYLGREQYGDKPLFFGESYASEIDFDKLRQRQRENDQYDYVRYRKTEKTVDAKATKNYRTVGAYLKQVHKFSKNDVELAFTDGDITINGTKVPLKQAVKSGDMIHAYSPPYYPDSKKSKSYPYQKSTLNLFPRMYDSRGPQKEEYKLWTGYNGKNGKKVKYKDVSGATKSKYIPSFGHNWQFFMDYQLDYMWWRYFMWNYSGRQNDIQGRGYGDYQNGNWISGVGFIDEAHVGNQDMLYSEAKNNPGRNEFYMIPLILGIIGLLFHIRANKYDAGVVAMLFLMTGAVLVIYLNAPPLQPRERDYVFVGSTYAFAIWIGLSVLAMYRFMKENELEWSLIGKVVGAFVSFGILLVAIGTFKSDTSSEKLISAVPGYSLIYIGAIIGIIMSLVRVVGMKILDGKQQAIIATVLGLVAPVLMAKDGWNDHDRSGRLTSRDLAENYLQSCEPNAIIFTNGDNDTFPLWYAQEVEKVRRDVRVVNLTLFDTDWYTNQTRRDAYESKRLPISFTREQTLLDRRSYVMLPQGKNQKRVSVGAFIKDLHREEYEDIEKRSDMEVLSNRLFLDVDKEQVIANGLVEKKDSSKIVDRVNINLGGRYVTRGSILLMDILNNNNWERPFYWAVTVGRDKHFGMQDYFQLEGLAYKFVPIKTKADGPRGQVGRVNTARMYDLLMNKFKWGNMNEDGVYLDEQNKRMSMNLRSQFGRLTSTLVKEYKSEKDPAKKEEIRAKIVKALDKCFELMPNHKVAFDYGYSEVSIVDMIGSYFEVGEYEKGLAISGQLMKNAEERLDYYFSLDTDQYEIFFIDEQIQNDLMYLMRYTLPPVSDLYRRHRGAYLKWLKENPSDLSADALDKMMELNKQRTDLENRMRRVERELKTLKSMSNDNPLIKEKENERKKLRDQYREVETKLFDQLPHEKYLDSLLDRYTKKLRRRRQ